MKVMVIDNDGRQIEVPVESLKLGGISIGDIYKDYIELKGAFKELSGAQIKQREAYEKRLELQDKRFKIREQELLTAWEAIK